MSVAMPQIPMEYGFRVLPPEIRAEDHLGLVRKAAKKFTRPGEKIEDTLAYSDGCLGLLRAIDTFDESWGTTFSTHATSLIKKAIIDEHRNRSRKKRSIPVTDIDDLTHKQKAGIRKIFERSAFCDLPLDEIIEELLKINSTDNEMDKRSKIILGMYYLGGKTLAEIGEEFRVTREMIRQYVSRAIKLIKKQHVDMLAEIENA